MQDRCSKSVDHELNRKQLNLHYLLNTSIVTTSSMPYSIQRIIYREPMSQRRTLSSVNLLKGTPQQSKLLVLKIKTDQRRHSPIIHILNIHSGVNLRKQHI